MIKAAFCFKPQGFDLLITYHGRRGLGRVKWANNSSTFFYSVLGFARLQYKARPESTNDQLHRWRNFAKKFFAEICEKNGGAAFFSGEKGKNVNCVNVIVPREIALAVDDSFCEKSEEVLGYDPGNTAQITENGLTKPALINGAIEDVDAEIDNCVFGPVEVLEESDEEIRILQHCVSYTQKKNCTYFVKIKKPSNSSDPGKFTLHAEAEDPRWEKAVSDYPRIDHRKAA